MLYYALVLRHPVEGKPLLPVTEMLTNDHSASSIRAFVERFKRDESNIFKGKVTTPRQVNTDYSKAIILAVLKEFNGESLNDFLNRACRLLRKEANEVDYHLMVPHVGCSYFMHIVHRNVMAIIRSKRNSSSDDYENRLSRWYRFNMYCASLLVNSKTLEEFDAILQDVVICLLSKNQNELVKRAFDRLWKKIHEVKDTFDLSSFVDEFEIDDEDMSECDNSKEDDIFNMRRMAVLLRI